MKIAPLTPAQVGSFAKTVVSGDVALPIAEKRLAVCHACEYHVVERSFTFCTECGCPRRKRARLEYKVRKKGATCPKGKWDE